MENKTNLEINKHYKFDWCIIKNNNKIICYNANQSCNVDCLRDDAMINVEIWIDEIGLLHIESPNRIIHECALHKVPVSELEHTPSSKCVKHYEGIKWLGIKPYDYVYGWWYYKSDKPANYILSNYILIIK